jgi:putative transposase
VQAQGLSVVGYCLMSNHVHRVVVPPRAEALAVVLKQTHGRYASYWNVSHASSGQVWQGRFYSCPMDPGYLWEALRYAELNPVRAGMAVEAEAWPWSSAAAHCGTAAPDACLEMKMGRDHWSEATWRKFQEAGETESDLFALRRCTHTGRPLGPAEFVQRLEQGAHRRLVPQKGGRPRRTVADSRHDTLALAK